MIYKTQKYNLLVPVVAKPFKKCGFNIKKGLKRNRPKKALTGLSRSANWHAVISPPGHVVQNKIILVSKLRSGTSKTKAGALFRKSQWGNLLTSIQDLIFYHVTGWYKGRPILSI